jgi:hypothetical protein
MSESLSLSESFASLSPENLEAIVNECAKMSQDFSDYQVDFTTDLMTLSDIITAMDNVKALGMQSDIHKGKVQTILFDPSTGFLTSCIMQQPIFVATFDDTDYGVSGRHRTTALKALMPYGLSGDTMIQVVRFKPSSMAIAMHLVTSSNGSRAVSKGENSNLKLARYGVLPEVKDCLRAGRDNTLPQVEAFQNAAWLSYNEQKIGARNNSTVQSIAKSFFTLAKKMNYDYNQICDLLDPMLHAIETASKLTNTTNVSRGSGTIAENIVKMFTTPYTDKDGKSIRPIMHMKEKESKKVAKRDISATLFTRNL